MGNYTGDDYALGGRFKSARQKKRLVKIDFEKKLIRIHKEEKRLWKTIRELPPVPLEKPYQQGWVRFFVVRDDVMRSKEGMFFQNLLEKINTSQYCNNKAFKSHKAKHKPQVFWEQSLYKIPAYEWNSDELGLTDKEKSFFFKTEKWSDCFKRYMVYYKFSESWRYALKVRPYIVTHQKALDADLESQAAELENYIVKNNLRHKIAKMNDGWVNYKPWREIENPKYFNPHHNKSLNALYQEYLNENI